MYSSVKKFATLIFCVMCFTVLFIGVYALQLFSENKLLETFEEHSNKPTLCFFGAKWCGYCKKFKPEWERLKSMQNELPVMLVEKEHTNESHKPLFEQHKVKGFPTLTYCPNGIHNSKNCVVYKGDRKVVPILQFLKHQN